MTVGRHRDPAPSTRDRRTINALATAAAVLTAASVHGIVTTPSTPNVNTSIGQDTADTARNATKSRVTGPQPFPDTQDTPASVHGIVTTPSTPNVNTSIGQDTADTARNATKSRVTGPQPFPDTQDTPAPETTTTGHTEEQP